MALLALLLAPPLACGQEEPEGRAGGLSRSEFIDVVVAIRKAEFDVESEDSAATRFEARRDSILAAHELTDEDLYAFVDRHPELGYMDAVWDSVTERLKRPLHDPPREDTAAAPREPEPIQQDDDGRRARPRSGIIPGG